MLEIRNRNYNRERANMTDWLMADVDRDRLIKRMHEEAAERIAGQIDDFYMRYATRTGLTTNEVVKQASEFDIRNYFDRARRAVEEKDFSKETNEWLSMYNLKMKTSRLEVLKAEINLELLEMYDRQDKLMSDELRREVEREIERQKQILAEAKSQTGVLSNSIMSPTRGIEGIVNSDFYGATFSERIWGRNGHYQSLQREIFASLNRMNVDMTGYRKERSRLIKRFNVSGNEAMRLLKTESSRIRADTQLEMGKANGFTHAIYVAEPDACPDCSPLDGMAIPIDKAEKGINFYPRHPNCKCSSFLQIEMERVDGTTNLDEYKMWEDTEI